MSSTTRIKRRKLLLVAVTCILADKHRRKKNTSRWTRQWLARRSTLGFSHTLVPKLVREDSAEFRAMFRMDMMAFEQLLGTVAALITKENTAMTMSISPRDKLLVTLRYLATG